LLETDEHSSQRSPSAIGYWKLEKNTVSQSWSQKGSRRQGNHIDALRRIHEPALDALRTDFCGLDLIPHGKIANEAKLYVEEVKISEREAIMAVIS